MLPYVLIAVRDEHALLYRSNTYSGGFGSRAYASGDVATPTSSKEHLVATPLQYAASAFTAGLSATCAGGTALANQTNIVWHSTSYPDPSSKTALELTFQLDHRLGAGHHTQPEYVPNESVADITLEHVLPRSPSEEWDVDDDLAESTANLLGNMALIKSNQNRDLGNLSFPEKQKVYGKSGYILTKRLAGYDDWGLDEIRDRQAQLAKLAVKTWPIN